MSGEIEITSGSPATEVEKQLEAQGYEVIREVAADAPKATDEGMSSGEDKESAGQRPESAERPDGVPGKKGLQKRIDTLTRRNSELAAQLEDLKRTQSSSQPQATPARTAERPSTDQFQSYEDYVEALAGWKFDERQRQFEADRALAEQREHAQAAIRSHTKSVESARVQHDDYDEVTNRDDVMIPEAARIAIVESPDSGEIVYHLGKHPDVAERLQELSPFQQAVEIGRISAAIERQGKREPRDSTAPAPVRTLTGNSARPSPAASEMSYQEFKRARESGSIR